MLFRDIEHLPGPHLAIPEGDPHDLAERGTFDIVDKDQGTGDIIDRPVLFGNQRDGSSSFHLQRHQLLIDLPDHVLDQVDILYLLHPPDICL